MSALSFGRHGGPRSAFTLVEVMIVVVIVALLTSLALGGLFSARQRVKIDKTRNTIRKIHEIVMPQFESYTRRRVLAPLVGSGAPTPGLHEAFGAYVDRSAGPPRYYGPRTPSGAWPPPGAAPAQVVAASRLQMLRMIQILEMPDSWGDVALNSNIVLGLPVPGTLAINGIPIPSYARTGPVSSYASFRQSRPLLSPSVNGAAECLYLIVACGGFEPDVMEQFRGDEIGDTDNDGAPEFIDAWGRPIQFIRWAPGVSAAGFPRPSPVQIANPISNHDPLDPMRVDTGGYALVPLIYSEGPDGVADSLVTTGAGGWSSLVRGSQSLMSVADSAINDGGRVNTAIGPGPVADNIFNHDLMSK